MTIIDEIAKIQVESNEKPSVKTETEVYEADGISVDLLSESVRLNLGKGFYKFISYSDFASALLNIIDKDGGSTKGKEYIFPPNIFYLNVAPTNMQLSMYYPECVRELTYRSDTKPRVVPNIVISHSLHIHSDNKWRVSDTRYWSTAKPLSELERTAYLRSSPPAGFALLPFTNVYDTGSLCYGANVRISEVNLPDLRALHWYYEMLFTSPFNDDLGLKAVKRNSKYKLDNVSWYKFLADLAEKGEKFPYNQIEFY